jgi:spermidine synthase
VVRLSADFAPAYTPLLGMARQLHGVDPPAARALLMELEEANPARPEARALLTKLYASSRKPSP